MENNEAYTKEPVRAGSRKEKVVNTVLAVLCALMGIVILLRVFVFELCVVQGDSMLPNFADGQIVLVNRRASPQRFDVVLIEMTEQESGGEKERILIKRVIALAGETIWCENNVVHVRREDGTELVLTKERIGFDTYETRDFSPVTVPQGTVYLLGDNRPVSKDSRFFGAVDVSKIHGVVV